MQIRNFIAAATATVFALASQGLAHATDCEWTATTAKAGVDTPELTVKGLCQEPTPDYTLTLWRVEPTEASTLTLVLEVVAPTGNQPQHVSPTPVEYKQRFGLTGPNSVPKKVIVLEHAATINVQ